MKTQKLIGLFIILAIFAFAFTACENPADSNDNTPPLQSDFYGSWKSSNISGTIRTISETQYNANLETYGVDGYYTITGWEPVENTQTEGNGNKNAYPYGFIISYRMITETIYTTSVFLHTNKRSIVFGSGSSAVITPAIFTKQ